MNPATTAALAALAVLVACGYLFDVHLPGGARVPLGASLTIALAELLPPAAFASVLALGLALTLPILIRRSGSRTAVAHQLVRSASAASAAGAVALLHWIGAPFEATDVTVFLHVVAAGAAYFVTEQALRPPVSRSPLRSQAGREVVGVHVSLICAGALTAIGYRHHGGSLPAAALAVIPLVVIRFSFQRYARARETYDQTIEALSLLPEVAGMVPLGHGTRTAVFAEAIARGAGLDEAEVVRVRTAARLHHIGDISRHEPSLGREVDPDDLARVAGELLRATGFLADAADLVEAAQPGRPPASTMSVAAIRVAGAFDRAEEQRAVPEGDSSARCVELLRRFPDGLEHRAVLLLAGVLAARPDLVAEGEAAVRHLAMAAHSE